MSFTLELEDFPRLLPAFIDARNQKTALRLSIHVPIRGSYKNRRRAVHRVAHRGEFAGLRITHGDLTCQPVRTDQITDRVTRILRPGTFLDRQDLVFQTRPLLVEKRLRRKTRQFYQILRRTEAQRRILKRRLARSGTR